ncbi:MAG: trypsin-like peptidase domain-containing protein [Spirochaetales bacterium]|nr:trypsin-like peptidase domain-containing protein [Spirochaetales bacterium]
MKKKIISIIFTLFFASIILLSCSSIKQPKSVAQIPDFSDDDIANLEIERIHEFMEDKAVYALWRANLLGNKAVIDECEEKVRNLMKASIDEKKYFDANRFAVSLKALNFSVDSETEKLIQNGILQNLPAAKNNKAPSKISDCVNATATIWVDRGVKIRYGAGYADIIIGSGFFIDERGYLITNYHVIDSMVNPDYEGFSRLYIKLYEDMDTKIPAKVVGYDKMLDLALLKVELEPNYVLNLGSSSELSVGDRVLAIGSPVGLEGTLTSGIVSSSDRKLLTLGNVFQIDAAVNSGNSGGPLIDEKMNVQAIIFAGMLQYQGLNFAIPVEYLKQELAALYNENQIIHPWIGAFGKTFKSKSNKSGLEILYVMPGSPSHLAGLKEGDVLKAVSGKTITSLEDFQYTMLSYEPGTILTFEYDKKDGENFIPENVNIYLDERPENPMEIIYNSDYISNAFYPLFGMKLVSADEMNRRTFIVKDVLKNTAAEELHFSNDDVITINTIQIDKNTGILYAQIYAKRKVKGFLDVGMLMQTQLDSPYIF